MCASTPQLMEAGLPSWALLDSEMCDSVITNRKSNCGESEGIMSREEQSRHQDLFITIAIAVGVNVAFILPSSLVGVLAVQVRESLGISLWSLGVIVATFRAASAVFISMSGSVVDRIGALRSMRLSALLSSVSLGGIALFAFGSVSLVAWLLLAAGSLALGTPAVNRLLIARVSHGSQGFAFGVKNAGAPLATLIAGLAVPLIALTIGWRWVFGLLGFGAAALAVTIPKSSNTGRLRSTASNRFSLRRFLVLPGRERLEHVDLAVAFGLSMAAASALPTFLSDYSVSIGIGEARAGLIVAAGSIASIATRILSGRMLDTFQLNGLAVPALMVLGGVVGFAMLAVGDPRLVMIGSVLAFSLGWGFNAVFWVAALRISSASPALVTSSIMPGGLIGGLVGPLVFGYLAGEFGYRYAWVSSATLGTLGAAAMLRRGASMKRSARRIGPEAP